jgi:hypothetical protein
MRRGTRLRARKIMGTQYNLLSRKALSSPPAPNYQQSFLTARNGLRSWIDLSQYSILCDDDEHYLASTC